MSAYLVLENGKIFKGESFGHMDDVIGEVVFTTGMSSYLKTLSDKNYFGQIIVQTFPLIGNYGVNLSYLKDTASCKTVYAKAYIVKHWCQNPSDFRSKYNIDTFLKSQKIVGLCGIDTRALTKIIRENGVINGKITSSIDDIKLDEIRSYKINSYEIGEANVSTDVVYHQEALNSKFKIAIIDFGLHFKDEFLKRNCDVWVLPNKSSLNDILSINADGIVLSDGPGNPSDNIDAIAMVKQLIKTSKPILGIGLGHQLLAIANGFKTEKLKFGHRGDNQPVCDLSNGKIYTTSQNHGYIVAQESINKKIARELFVNVNDNTCEGLGYLNAPIYSVSFRPESCSDSLDFVFNKFFYMMEE